MRTRFLGIAVSLLILCFNANFVAAQSVTFAGAQTPLGRGLTSPFGVAVDKNGNVFISDRGGDQVVEITANGLQITLPITGLNYPEGIAVDSAGDVFVADQNNNRVVELPAGGVQTTVGTGLNTPSGVAVDGSGNIFIADNGNSRVVKVPAGGGTQTTVGTGLSGPAGVAVDVAGNVFIADLYNNRVVEVPVGGGPQTTVGSNLVSPVSVAVDQAGDVFIANAAVMGVVEVLAGSGNQITVLTGPPVPYYVALDAVGNIYISDSNNQTFELQYGAVDFGTANVCPGVQTTPAPCNQNFTLNYTVNAPTTFGTVNVLTQGAPNLDFTLGSSTCTGTLTSGSSCTVTATFAPRAPGVRMGAVQLTDNSGNVLVTTLIHGIGMGPAIAFGPGVQTTVPAVGLVNSYGVAVDGAGDVFIADPSNVRVVEVPAGGGAQTTVGSGLINPIGVAVDGAGDVFIADTGLTSIVEVPAGGGPQTTIGSGLSGPHGVAVDGSGNVFIADSGNSRVVEVSAAGGPQTTVGTGLNPLAVAVDGAGNLFVADRNSGNDRVVEVPANGGPQTTIVSGLYNPSGVAVDAAGDVFVADFDNSRVLEVPAGGGPATNVGVGLNFPFNVAVDGTGNLFIMDWGNSRVVELHRAQPPTFNFASTAVGNTSTDSPQSVTVQNIGNQPLAAVAPGLSIGANFVQVAGSGSPADCTSTFSLSPGATCNLSVSFTPQTVGSLVSSATFTDNALNAAANSTSASQSVALQGTATQGSQTINFGALPNQSLGTAPFGLSATASSSLAVSFASTTPIVCTISGATVTLAAAGTCTIQATQAGNANYAAATPVNQNFQISDFTLTSNSPSATVTAGRPATFTLTLTPQSSFASAITLSCGGLPAMASCTFTPSATVIPNVSTVTTTLNINTKAHTTALALPPSRHRSVPLYAIWLLLPGMFLGILGMAAPKGRKPLSCCFVLLLVSGCLLQAACGSGSPGVNTASGTPAGTYSVTVTGTSGSNQHAATIKLTVQ